MRHLFNDANPKLRDDEGGFSIFQLQDQHDIASDDEESES